MHKCPSCKKTYKDIGKHWGHSCDYPNITEEQHEILSGVLLGDGNVDNRDSNPRFRIQVNEREFIEWFSEKMGVLAKSISQVEHSMNDGYDRDNSYSIKTVTHPDLKRYANWYNSGKKRYPENLRLTPTKLKLWYVTDGDWNYKNNQFRITCSSQIHRDEYLKNLFNEFNFNPTISTDTIVFSVSDSKRLLEWIGEPISGYQYKWGYLND